MSEQVKVKEKKEISKGLIITGIILGIATVITGICLICKATGVSVSADLLVAGSAWCLLVFPFSLFMFLIALMWNTTKTATAASVKMVLTVVLMFIFALYSMFAIIMVWIVKVDNTPVTDAAVNRYQIIREVDELV